MWLESKDVIYVITCAGCNEYYIGETSNSLRAHLHVHKQHINSPEYRQIDLSTNLETCGKKNSLFSNSLSLEMPVLSRDEKKKKNLYLYLKTHSE